MIKPILINLIMAFLLMPIWGYFIDKTRGKLNKLSGKIFFDIIFLIFSLTFLFYFPLKNFGKEDLTRLLITSFFTINAVFIILLVFFNTKTYKILKKTRER